MRRLLLATALPLLALLWPTPPAPAQTKAPPFTVADNAGLFSEAAKRSANDAIARIKKETGKDLLIETFKSAPDTIKKIDVKDAKARGLFFRDWAVERARNARVNGVYVLICTDPKYVEAAVGQKTLESGMFTKDNRIELRNRVRDAMQKGKPDAALEAAVDYVKLHMKAAPAKGAAGAPKRINAAPGATPPTAEAPDIPPWVGWVCLIVVVLAVIWLVVGLFRAFSGGFGGGSPGYGGAGWGGGFLPSLLGGLFGGMAGMWLYDHFFRGGGPSAHAAPPADYGAGGAESAPTDVGGDYYAGEGGGGDYGDAGGDFGGDAGGGDFGGGDFGGGGDW